MDIKISAILMVFENVSVTLERHCWDDPFVVCFN